MRNFGALTCALVCLTGTPVLAQSTIEENAPAVNQGKQISNLPGLNGLDPQNASNEGLGKNLVGVKLVGEPGQVIPVSNAAGVVSTLADVPGSVNIDRILGKYIGREISFKMLFDMRDDIVRAYRKAGHAFVAATIPPQEISSGSVQIIVTESKLAEKRVEGVTSASQEYILQNIAAEEGETVDTNQLIEDLNWLNLNPYRNLVVVAEPGKEFGETNLTFKANEKKPWTIYGGYNNYGTPATDRDRIYAGFHIANLPFTDHQLSYQGTISPHAINRLSQSTSAQDQTAYMSHDGNYFVPLPWRHKFRARAAYIKSRSRTTNILVNESETLILSGEYAAPLPTVSNLRSEFYTRYEYKNSARDVFAFGTQITEAEIDVHQFLFGVRGNGKFPIGRFNYDFRAVVSPGDLSDNNSAANFAAFSGNTGADPEYFYFYGNIENSLDLPNEFSLLTKLTGQWADEVLPSTESFSLGGRDTVRGYYTSEVAGERGIVLRNELHLDFTSRFDAFQEVPISKVDVFAFADLGHVENLATNTSESLAGAGVGLNVGLAENVLLNGDVGYAFTDAGRTQKGDVRANLNLTFRF